MRPEVRILSPRPISSFSRFERGYEPPLFTVGTAGRRVGFESYRLNHFPVLFYYFIVPDEFYEAVEVFCVEAVEHEAEAGFYR